MQHNNWSKDRDLLAEAVSKVFSEQHDPELEGLAKDAMAYDQQEDPSREVEDLTDELVALDPKKGYTVDDWMEEVAFPYIKKNHS